MLGSTGDRRAARRLRRWRRRRWWRYTPGWRRPHSHSSSHIDSNGHCYSDGNRYRNRYGDRDLQSDWSPHVNADVDRVAHLDADVDCIAYFDSDVNCVAYVNSDGNRIADESPHAHADESPDVDTNVYAYDHSNTQRMPDINSESGTFCESGWNHVLNRTGTGRLQHRADRWNIPWLGLW